MLEREDNLENQDFTCGPFLLINIRESHFARSLQGLKKKSYPKDSAVLANMAAVHTTPRWLYTVHHCPRSAISASTVVTNQF